MRDAFLLRILEGRSDANIRFADLTSFLKRLGFVERIKGDHHIFSRDGVADSESATARRVREAVSGEAGPERDSSV